VDPGVNIPPKDFVKELPSEVGKKTGKSYSNREVVH
jgi:hypothetical protein